MNLFVYDDFLNKSRYNRVLNKIEIRLTDLGLNGKILRLGSIKNTSSLIQQEVRNGAKNIIAVGNNFTVNKVVSALVDNNLSDLFLKDVLFSLIPVGDNQSIAQSLGIEKEEEACNIILARRIEKINIGLAGKNYFINKAEIKKSNILLDFNDFKVEVSDKNTTSIYNLFDNTDILNKNIIFNNNKIKVVITNKNGDLSYLQADNLQINGEDLMLIDNSITINLPKNIGLLKNKLNVIVGKNRLF